MEMNKINLIILVFLSFCFTNVTSDYFIFNKSINDHHAIGFNPSYMNYNYDGSKFKISFSADVYLSNNSLSLDWLNNSLLSGKDYTDDKDKADFLSIFEDDNISITSFTQMKFGFNYKDYSFLSSPESFGTILLPYSIIDLVFYGLEFDKNISFDTEKSQFQAVLPITFAHSRELDQYLTGLNLPLKNIRAGLGAKLLLGLAFFETNFNNSTIDSEEGSVQMKGDIQSTYSLFGSRMIVNENDYGNSEFELGSDFGFSGTGFAFDLGFSADYSENINFGLSLNNILGQIVWSESSTYEYNMSYDLNISSDQGEYDDAQMDSLITYESNQPISDTKSTPYPSYLLVNGNYEIKDFVVSSHILAPFNDAYYKSFQFSIGLSYNKFKKLPLYFQLNFDGDNHFKWFTGLNLDFKYYEFKIGISQQDGFINSAKGISFGFSSIIKF